MVIKTVLKSTMLLSLLAGFSTAYATPGDDIKTATADVVFSSAVTLNHELHSTADAFRISDLGTVTGTNAQFNKPVLVAQGKVSVASGVWNAQDEFVVKFSAGCANQQNQGNGVPVTCVVNGGGNNDSILTLQLKDVNSTAIDGIDSAGWGRLPEHQGIGYYNVNVLSDNSTSQAVADLVGDYNFGIDAAVFEN